MNNRTFAIIKPDAVKNGNTGKIYDRILKADFKILCAKLLRMTVAQAEDFYAVHRERPFFNELIEFMSSGARRNFQIKPVLFSRDEVKREAVRPFSP